MRQKTLSFAETLTAAVRLLTELHDPDGNPALTKIARHCAQRGHPVSQPTLYRHFHPNPAKPRALEDDTAKALEAVFHIPARIWKGEPMTEAEAKALSQFHYETILLAQKIEGLPKKDRDALLIQIENAHANQEELKRLMTNGNVTPIDRSKR